MNAKRSAPVQRVKCGRVIAEGLSCDRWAEHPGRCAPDPDAIELDFEYSMRIRIVEATELQAAELRAVRVQLERIANTLAHDGVVVITIDGAVGTFDANDDGEH